MTTKWRLLAEVADDEAPPLRAQDWREQIVLLDPALPPGDNWLTILVSTDAARPLYLRWVDTGTDPVTRPDRYYVPTDADDGFAIELQRRAEIGRASCRERV